MEDEVHFQLYGSSCRMWIPPEEKDPVLFHHPTRKSTGYFGAVRIRDGKFLWQREDGKFNGESFFTFLKKLRISSKNRRRIVVILDNARYHHARLHKGWRHKSSKQFELVFLPPYSPELNVIERVWKLTRRISIHNQYFPSLNQVTVAVESQFLQWQFPNSQLLKLCAVI